MYGFVYTIIIVVVVPLTFPEGDHSYHRTCDYGLNIFLHVFDRLIYIYAREQEIVRPYISVNFG